MADPVTGALRNDIELIPSGKHGDFPMLFDPQADAYFKISPKSMNIIARLNQSYPVAEFLQKLNETGIHVSQQELLELLAFLQQNNLISPEYGHISAKRNQHRKMREKTTFLRLSAAYLFFKLPPIRPEKFLQAAKPFLSPLASKPFIIALLIPAVLGYLMVIRYFDQVSTAFINSLTWAGLANYFFAILFLKLIHESAHVISATHFDCRVRGIGLGFMVFFPRLFTDTTDSWRLPRKQRLLVDGAGIIIELLLGGIAALLWVYLPEGSKMKATMFYVFAVSTISTILVNGNPCIRYDGYYLLCDITGIENLMTRSAEYVKQFWRWFFLRLGTRPHERHGAFLLVFGVASFIYRLFLYTSIILIIYHKFVQAIAVVLVFFELYSIVIYPFYREFKTIRMLSKRSTNRARWILAAVVLVLVTLVMLLPISWNISLPGEIKPEKQLLISVVEPGYLTGKLPRFPVNVKKNDLLFELNSPLLDFSSQRLRWTLIYDEQLFALLQLEEKTLGRAIVSQEKINSDRVGQEEFVRRKAALTVNAEMDGVFVPRIRDTNAGMYLPKGKLVAEIVSPQLIVQAYAGDRDIARLTPRKDADGNDVPLTVTVKLPDTLKEYSGTIKEVFHVPAKLRNSPLLQHFGGPIPVYLDESKPGEYPSVMALYRIEIAFDEQPELFAGRVVKVTVHHRERLFDRVWQLMVSAFRREF